MSMQIRSKKDLKEALPPFLAFLGVCVIVCAVMFLWGGIADYQMRQKQVDWPVADATVMHVDEESRTTHNHARYTVYTIHYQYSVDGQVYGGNFEQNRGMQVGETMQVKYDPNDPAYSTHVLEPSISSIVIGFVLAVAGVTAIIEANVLEKKRKLVDARCG